VVGIDFIGETLYAITGSSEVYEVNTATGVAVYRRTASITGITALAYDANNPARLYTVVNSRLASISLTASLDSVTTAGAGSMVGLIQDSAQADYVFEAISAMEIGPGGDLYALATLRDLDPLTDLGRYLITIDTTTAQATRIAQLSGGPTDLTSLAYDSSSGNFYGVEAAVPDQLWTVDPATAIASAAVTLSVNGLVGVERVQFGKAGVLLGVTVDSVYSIDPATGTCTLLKDTGLSAMSSVAYDNVLADYQLWTTENSGGYKLAQIGLLPMLEQYTGGSTVSDIGRLVHGNKPVWMYNVHGMDADSADTIYAVATLTSLDPLGNPAPALAQLVTIDGATAAVTEIVQLDVADLSTIAFNASDVLYGVNPATDELVTVNTTTGVTTVVATLGAAGVTGIDFAGADLYGVGGSSLYLINASTGDATAQVAIDIGGTASGLAGSPSDTGKLWVTVDVGGTYMIRSIYTDPDVGVHDMGKIVIAGTVAGEITTEGNWDIIRLGYLWGDINIGKNMGYILLEKGSAARQDPDDEEVWYTPDSSVIHVHGSCIMIDSRGGAGTHWAGGVLWADLEDSNGTGPNTGGSAGDLQFLLGSAIQVDFHPDVALPSSDLQELEYGADDLWLNEDGNKATIDSLWRAGTLLDYFNDVPVNAQFISHPSGDFTISGDLTYAGNVELPLGTYAADWYAMPLMAGQTVQLSSNNLDPNRGVVLIAPDGIWVDSYGYETEEDWGIGSRPGVTAGTPKAMVYTAPQAGIYYVVVVGNVTATDTGYKLSIVNGTDAALGGVNVCGDYRGQFFDVLDGSGADITVANGGNLGGVAITRDSFGATVTTQGGGDIIAFESAYVGREVPEDPGTVTGGTVTSTGNIGRVAAKQGYMCITSISAGSALNTDAYIQNIATRTDFVADTAVPMALVTATGSMGVITTGASGGAGSIGGISIQLNTDSIGPGGRLDLIDIRGGNWGVAAIEYGDPIGIPSLRHGPGGDIGYVYVSGDIYADWGLWTTTGDVQDVVIDGSVILNDDGGGRMTVTLGQEYTTDAQGVVTTVNSTGTFTYIPVDDYLPTRPFGGIGGVIANLNINGSATFETEGVVQVSVLNIAGAAGAPAGQAAGADIVIGGSGQADIYYVAGAATSIVNSTPGTLVSGTLTAIDTIQLGGSIGSTVGATGAWTYGYPIAPAVAVGSRSAEPQYGWFNNKINGLNITGDIRYLTVDGSLGDLRVEGELGVVRVNADGSTQGSEWNSWEGVRGLVWSETRIIDINVGDGLADDGASDRAEAAILSSGSIGTVRIDGAYYVAEPPLDASRDVTLAGAQVYGLLNGSILAQSDETVAPVDEAGNPILGQLPVYVPAIGRIVGTNGAKLTALVGGVDLDVFVARAGTVQFSGGIGEVTFSGLGAEITGAEFMGHYARMIETSASDSYGINNIYVGITYTIGAMAADPASPLYGVDAVNVRAGGPGLSDSYFSCEAGNIGVIEGTGAFADLTTNTFVSTHGMVEASARNLTGNEFYMPGTLWGLTSTNDMVSNIAEVGAIGDVSAGRDFLSNTVNVAGEITSMVVTRDFNSTVELYGPTVANLVSLRVVDGNLSGTITSHGHIGQIITDTGVIDADIQTVRHPEVADWNRDVELIRTAGGYTGTLDVAGSLEQFVSTVSLGSDPTTTGTGKSQLFSVWNDLGRLEVRDPAGTTTHLYARWDVGGDIGDIDVGGNFYSEVTTNGNLTSLVVDGAMGGQVGKANYGALTVLGEAGSMQFSTQQSIVADLDIGGSIDRITLAGGDVVGNITSRYGSIEGMRVVGGDITGNITGNQVEYVEVEGGDISGNITAQTGDIRLVHVRNGNISGTITTTIGRINKLIVANGGILAGAVITANAGFGEVGLYGGDLAGSLVSSIGGIDRVLIKTTSDLTGSLNMAGDIQSFYIEDSIGTAAGGNGVIRSGGRIVRLMAGSVVNGSIISSRWHMEDVD
ncbi:MAG: hypothetical protein J7M14_03050, partial [Planctomycetes bacterium]|nr:hypothetical protein [Planctomycetota bacterium]